MSSFTTAQKAMAIAPKVSGFISLCSSTFIVFHVLRSPKRRKLTYHRLLCGMSMSDMIGSLMCVLSTWPIPKGEAYLAAGTVQTCAAQGFFNQTAALCTPTYNISLAIYYLLVIVKGWKEKKVSRVEKFMHALPIAAGLGTGIAGAVLKLYNGAGWICWIAPGLPNHPDRHNPNFGIFRLAFLYADAWAIICFLAISMAVIYFYVLRQEKSFDKYHINQSFAIRRRRQSKKIRNQAFLYVGCMYMTWLFGSTFRLMQFAGKKPPTVIIVLFVTFFPLQGFFNLVVYMFPRIMRYVENGTPLRASFVDSFHGPGRRRSSFVNAFHRRSSNLMKEKRSRVRSEVKRSKQSELKLSSLKTSTVATASEALDDTNREVENLELEMHKVSFSIGAEEECFDDECIDEEMGDAFEDDDCEGENDVNQEVPEMAEDSDAIDELAHIVQA